MNSKGQAFSVFNLLIAAIVAFAILYILLTILPPPGPMFQDPNDAAKQLIPTAMNSPGSVQTSAREASFDNESNLAPSAIVAESGITAENICILKHDFADDERFVFRRNTLYYESTSSMTLKISAVCERAGQLQEILNVELDNPATIAPGDAGDIACGSNCDAVNDPNKTCCAILLNFRR